MERPAEGDDVNRRMPFQQCTDLYRGGVGAQQLTRPFGCDVEGVGLAARRVVGRKIQRVEVELLGFDLGSLGKLPPIATKVSAMCSARIVMGCRAPVG